MNWLGFNATGWQHGNVSDDGLTLNRCRSKASTLLLRSHWIAGVGSPTATQCSMTAWPSTAVVFIGWTLNFGRTAVTSQTDQLYNCYANRMHFCFQFKQAITISKQVKGLLVDAADHSWRCAVLPLPRPDVIVDGQNRLYEKSLPAAYCSRLEVQLHSTLYRRNQLGARPTDENLGQRSDSVTGSTSA